MSMSEEQGRHDQQFETSIACAAFLGGVKFIVADASRDPRFFERHLLSYVAQDLVESAVSISLLVRQGVLNVCKRDPRFILEASIKRPCSTASPEPENRRRIEG